MYTELNGTALFKSELSFYFQHIHKKYNTKACCEKWNRILYTLSGKPMKIVHVVEPFASGIATFVRSLVENLQDDLHIIVHGERELVMKSAMVKQDFPKDNVRFIRWKSAQRELNIRKDTVSGSCTVP